MTPEEIEGLAWAAFFVVMGIWLIHIVSTAEDER